MDTFTQAKKDKLRDIIRRVMANPHNLERVVDALAVDWNPMLNVKTDGAIEIIIGTIEPVERQS